MLSSSTNAVMVLSELDFSVLSLSFHFCKQHSYTALTAQEEDFLDGALLQHTGLYVVVYCNWGKGWQTGVSGNECGVYLSWAAQNHLMGP